MFIGTESDPAAPLTAFGGRYVDRFERRQGKWGIAVRLCLVEWAQTRNRFSPQTPPISWPRQGRWPATARTAPTSGPCGPVGAP